MEKMKLTEEKAFYYIKEGLMLLNFPDNLKIQSFILDDEMPYFHVYYESEVNGVVKKMLKQLSRKDVISLMKSVFEINNCDVSYIDIKVRDEKINYEVFVNIATYDTPKHKRKRR